MALLPDPELLILDEPTTGMDVEGRHDFWTAIRAGRRGGRTVIFATHYLEEADAYADRIVLVRHGQIVADGTAAEVKALASGRHGPGHAARRRRAGAGRRCPASTRSRSAATPSCCTRSDSDAVARHLLTQTAGPRPGDHLAQPRGRLPGPDRRRRLARSALDRTQPMTAADPAPHRAGRRPPFGGFIADLILPRAAPDDAQPPDA